MAQSRLGWYFEPVSSMGGAGAGAYRNTLAGAGVPEADLFAREAIQNSVDAALVATTPVRIAFREGVFEGAELDSLRSSLHLETGSSPLQRPPGLVAPHSLAAMLNKPLRVLYVEDFETAGLGGTIDNDPPTNEDNYFPLVCQLGETHKFDAGHGGTFGYGKAVYWAVSSLWTVVMYSRFRPTSRTQGVSARLITVSWFDAHTFAAADPARQVRYTGRAWFGQVVAEPGLTGACQPVTDDDAHDLAADLGFTSRRAEDATGLSLMILGHRVNIGELRKGIEKHWWPRLLDGLLEVDVENLPSPDPRSRTDLRRFVRCWDLLGGSVQSTDEDRKELLSYKRTRLGELAITTGGPGEEPAADSGEKPDSRRVRIALVRGPRMVVEYLDGPFIGPYQPDCEGVFVAADEMDGLLAASEPPAHTTWDWRTTRRDRGLEEEDRARIAKIYEKVKSQAREFLKTKQEPPPVPPPRCRELEKLLGKYLATETAGPPPPPPPSSDFFSIRFIEPVQRVETPDGTVLDSRISVALKDGSSPGEEIVVCRITAWVDLVLDQGARAPRSDRLRMLHMVATDPTDQEEILAQEEDEGSWVELLVRPGGAPIAIDLRSMPLPHPEYRAQFRILAERQ